MQLHFQVVFANYTLFDNLKNTFKKGLRELLTPWPRLSQQLGGLDVPLRSREFAIRLGLCFQ